MASLEIDSTVRELRAGEDVRVIVTRSPAEDEAVVVYIDTSFSPDGRDGGPGLRVIVNDEDAFAGVELGDEEEEREARDYSLTLSLRELRYAP